MANVTYKREKNKVEMSGESKDIRWPILFDLVSSRLLWLVPVIILLFIAPKASLLPLLWQWIKKQIPLLTLFLVAGDLLLSG